MQPIETSTTPVLTVLHAACANVRRLAAGGGHNSHKALHNVQHFRRIYMPMDILQT